MATPKVALVTGAGQGIGQGIAVKLASDGFDIAIADLAGQKQKAEAVVKEIEDLGRRAVFIETDVSDRDSVIAAVTHAAEQLGSFDVMVNNAGIAQIEPLLDARPDRVKQIFDVNVNGALWGVQAAAERFKKDGTRGKIINAASIAAIEAFPLLGIYSATKFAIRGITQVAAQELASDGITVNAYAPGIVGTAMWDQIDKEMHKINGKPLGQNMQESIDTIALGRVETPHDVAGVVSFLASENSDYVTGQVIIVDGGMKYN